MCWVGSEGGGRQRIGTASYLSDGGGSKLAVTPSEQEEVRSGRVLYRYSSSLRVM